MNIEIEVSEQTGPEYGKAFTWLFVGIGMLWIYGLLVWFLAAVAVVYTVWWIYRSAEAVRARAAATAVRADIQHQQVTSGDERGIYGTGYQDWRRYRDA